MSCFFWCPVLGVIIGILISMALGLGTVNHQLREIKSLLIELINQNEGIHRD